MSSADSQALGIVVIGRNEGERLRRCLESLAPVAHNIVYVDSGSTDGSLEVAAALGAEVVALETSVPFTAARARNAGFERLHLIAPDCELVQFVDGDCELVDGWLQAGAAFLRDTPAVSCVCGRLRERHPEKSVYNRLCNMEWDRPPGSIDACGGLFMVRAEAFMAAGGFRPDVVAGEEPELCSRLRLAGWSVWRLADEMAWHDAAMLRFGQWWTRTKRTGFAYAQRAHVSTGAVEPALRRQIARAWIWAVVIPVSTAFACVIWGSAGLLPLLLYPVQVVRTAVRGRHPWQDAVASAAFGLLGKFPEVLGQLEFATRRQPTEAARRFDYKT